VLGTISQVQLISITFCSKAIITNQIIIMPKYD
jgi:hypothetical protein